jgi:hypothetical protein
MENLCPFIMAQWTSVYWWLLAVVEKRTLKIRKKASLFSNVPATKLPMPSALEIYNYWESWA